MTRETDLMQSILLTFGSRSDCRLWRVNVGAFKDSGGRLVRYGIPGMADISGILAPSGRRIEIECKAANGRQTEQQKRWQQMIEKHGGLYVLARSISDVAHALGITPPDPAIHAATADPETSG